ncbi:MAG: Zn-dependent hydrolase [Burkholderiaceae bacterium]
MSRGLRIDGHRLNAAIDALAEIGPIPGGGNCRLALTDEDRLGRDHVVARMRALGLRVIIDRIGNVFGIRDGREHGPAVMTGSHIDTVRTGGRFDGNLGVLAGLEVIETLNAAGAATRHPLAVAVFTDEEGARFAPDMLGSLVHVGGLSLEQALDTRAIDGARLGDELARIGYAGDAEPGTVAARAFIELHVEQGPVLEREGVTIGAVHDLQGISWQAVRIAGQSNHAGTTPMHLRHDAGYCAARIACRVRELTAELGSGQVGTVGRLRLRPDLINVIAAEAELTVDLRHTRENTLREAERRLASFLDSLAASEGVHIETESLARFEPVRFDDALAGLVADTAVRLGLSVRRMTSGAGHDAQMMARVCPSAMIFVPSRDGLSHNPAEYTAPHEIEAGANVLLQCLLALADPA